MDTVILELKDLRKQYPGVLALRECSFDLRPGEVHALVGENGAGKSTLIKISTGVIQPTSGTIRFRGEPVVWSGPRDAIANGIGAVYQDPAVFPDLSVAENIFMNHQPHGLVSRRIFWREMHEQTEALLERLNVRLDPRRKLGHLTAAERQLVEIGKALSGEAKVLFMDEPTSTLSGAESDNMFEIVRQLRAEGTAIVFISHRLDDIFTIADRVTALRDGVHVDTRKIDEVDHDTLVQMMVGREVKNLFPKTEAVIGDEAMRVEKFSRSGEYQEVSLAVRSGEILGLYGLVGAGRTELAKSILVLLVLILASCIWQEKLSRWARPELRSPQALATCPRIAMKRGLSWIWTSAKTSLCRFWRRAVAFSAGWTRARSGRSLRSSQRRWRLSLRA